MDDALVVTNLVYLGTLAVGGVLFVFFAFAFAVTLLMAGAGQGLASLVALAVRPFLGPARAGAEARTTAAAASPDRVRAAVVAKADAILAANRAAARAEIQGPEPRPSLSAAVTVRADSLVTVHNRVRPDHSPRTGTQPALAVGAH